MSPAVSREGWWLIFVLILAAIVRIWGIQHDLPYSYYGDEMHFVNRAVSFGSGDLNPHWFHKPAFYMYLLFVEYGLYFCAGNLFGLWSSVDEFAVSYVMNPGPFILIGRLTTLAFSMGSIFFVYLIGKRHFGSAVGVVAALLLALTFGHIESSRVVKADMPATFFAVASTYALLNFAKQGRLSQLAISAALAGLGAATKYYTVILILPACLAILLTDRNSGFAKRASRLVSLSMLVLITFSASFFVASPFNLLDGLGRHQTFGRFSNLARSSKEVNQRPGDFIAAPASIPAGVRQYVQIIISREGMGSIIGGICMFGVVAMLVFRELNLFLMMLVPLTFAAASVFAYPGYAAPRHQCPIYPFLAIAGAIAIVRTGDVVARAWGNRASAIALAMFLLAMCYPLGHIIGRSMDLSRKDTRNVAKLWIEENIPAGSKVVLAEDGPPLTMNSACLKSMIDEAERADPNGQFTAHFDTYLGYKILASKQGVAYDIFEIRLPWWRPSLTEPGVQTLDTQYDMDMGNPVKPVGIGELEHYVANDYKFVIVHSDQYGQFIRAGSRAKDRFPAYTRFYHELFERGDLVNEIVPGKQLRGPVVRIYKL